VGLAHSAEHAQPNLQAQSPCAGADAVHPSQGDCAGQAVIEQQGAGPLWSWRR